MGEVGVGVKAPSPVLPARAAPAHFSPGFPPSPDPIPVPSWPVIGPVYLVNVCSEPPKHRTPILAIRAEMLPFMVGRCGRAHISEK